MSDKSPRELGRDHAKQGKSKRNNPFDFYKENEEYMEYLEGYFEVTHP